MKLVAVTACPSGVAHTYLSAEMLQKVAKARGIEIKVETQGSVGIDNKITIEEVKAADAVILTKDVAIIEEERFKGKPTVRISVSDAIKKADQIIAKIQEKLENK